ncbi:hypothetical protein TDB9533_01330 [Thalassocella blandensis]|nr:hypothetical protein TDB9533_01330 [Thalassocella blandensis]
MVLGKRKHLHHSDWPKAKKVCTAQNLDLNILEKLSFAEERASMLNFLNKEFYEFRGRWYFFWSCNFCIENKTYKEIGGFDENFLGWGLEDVELGYRLLDKKVEFELIDNFVWHFIKPISVTREKYAQWLTNLQYFYKKYCDVRILELMSFEDIFFNTAIEAPNTSASIQQRYLNFERKLEFIEDSGLIKADID